MERVWRVASALSMMPLSWMLEEILLRINDVWRSMLLAMTAGEGGSGIWDAFWRRATWLLRAGVRATDVALRVLVAIMSSSDSSSSESSLLIGSSMHVSLAIGDA